MAYEIRLNLSIINAFSSFLVLMVVLSSDSRTAAQPTDQNVIVRYVGENLKMECSSIHSKQWSHYSNHSSKAVDIHFSDNVIGIYKNRFHIDGNCDSSTICSISLEKIERRDFGRYVCVDKNGRLQDKQLIVLEWNVTSFKVGVIYCSNKTLETYFNWNNQVHEAITTAYGLCVTITSQVSLKLNLYNITNKTCNVTGNRPTALICVISTILKQQNHYSIETSTNQLMLETGKQETTGSGMIAGITVTVIVVVIIMIAIGFLLFRNRSKMWRLRQRSEVHRDDENIVLMKNYDKEVTANKHLEDNDNTIYGVCILQSRVYVVRKNTELCIACYEDENMNIPSDTIPLNELSSVSDMVSCEKNQCLYLSDDKQNLIFKVRPTFEKVQTKLNISVENRSTKYMSVNAEGNLLLLFGTTENEKENLHAITVYSTANDAGTIHQISSSDDSFKDHELLQAFQITDTKMLLLSNDTKKNLHVSSSTVSENMISTRKSLNILSENQKAGTKPELIRIFVNPENQIFILMWIDNDCVINVMNSEFKVVKSVQVQGLTRSELTNHVKFIVRVETATAVTTAFISNSTALYSAYPI